eukprot:2495104-Prymnesium_polylepis.1
MMSNTVSCPTVQHGLEASVLWEGGGKAAGSCGNAGSDALNHGSEASVPWECGGKAAGRLRECRFRRSEPRFRGFGTMGMRREGANGSKLLFGGRDYRTKHEAGAYPRAHVGLPTSYMLSGKQRIDKRVLGNGVVFGLARAIALAAMGKTISPLKAHA